MEKPRYHIGSYEADDQAQRLVIIWADQHRSAFPYVWLRHALFHPAAGRPEQKVDTDCLVMDAADLAHVEQVNHTDGRIIIRWSPGNAATEFDAVWLRDNCLSNLERRRRSWHPKLWENKTSAEFEWCEFDDLQDDERRLKFLLQIRDYGIGLINGLDPVPEKVRELAAYIGPIRRTHFGELFDVRSVPDNQQGTRANIGATASNAQALHTDESWRHSTPGHSLFHCLKPDPDGGGASVYTDGIAAAGRLRRNNIRAFDLLCHVPIRWTAERNDNEYFRTRARAIALDQDGIVRGVRIADRTLPPLDLPEDMIEPAYEALAAFRRELYDERHTYKRVLQPGECVVFDNQRVLHTRRSFDPQSGERWLQQVSVDREEFQNTFRTLAVKCGRDDLARQEPDAGVLSQPLIWPTPNMMSKSSN